MEGHNPISQDRDPRVLRRRDQAGGVRPIREVLAEVLSQYRIVLPEAARRTPAVEAVGRR